MSALDSRRRRLALLSGGYAALAIAATWPLARHPSTQVPLGTLDSATVPFLSTWVGKIATGKPACSTVNIWRL